jgi:hypothetical protein
VAVARYEYDRIEGDEWHAEGRWEVDIKFTKC